MSKKKTEKSRYAARSGEGKTNQYFLIFSFSLCLLSLIGYLCIFNLNFFMSGAFPWRMPKKTKKLSHQTPVSLHTLHTPNPIHIWTIILIFSFSLIIFRLFRNFFIFIYTKNLLPREKQQNARPLETLFFLYQLSYFCAPLWFWSRVEFDKSSDCIHLDCSDSDPERKKNIMRRKVYTLTAW